MAHLPIRVHEVCTSYAGPSIEKSIVFVFEPSGSTPQEIGNAFLNLSIESAHLFLLVAIF